MSARTCALPSCESPLEGKRPDAKFCSPKCKQAAFSERKELERAAADAEVFEAMAERIASARAVLASNRAMLAEPRAEFSAALGRLRTVLEDLAPRPAEEKS